MTLMKVKYQLGPFLFEDTYTEEGRHIELLKYLTPPRLVENKNGPLHSKEEKQNARF